MAYLSELTGKVVADVNGERIGRLDDVIASMRSELPHPQIVALVVKRAGGPLLIPLADVVVLLAPAIALKRRVEDVTPYLPAEHDLYLVRDVLDKQIIDTNGMRVVRVNDLELARVNGDFYVANVDIGGLGLMRRLGLAKTTEKVAGRLGRKLTPGIISWDAVELLSGDQPLRLKVSSDRIADLHPADLAEIISDLSRAESSKLLDSLDVETVADTLEEVEPDFQASLVEGMSDERVADLLEEMAPDEAADLLAELPEEPQPGPAQPDGAGRGRGCPEAADLSRELGRRHHDHRVRRRPARPDRRADHRLSAQDGERDRDDQLHLRHRPR